MVPGLEDRIMNGSDEDVVHISEMVRPLISTGKYGPDETHKRFRRGCAAPVPMTRKVSKAQFLIG
jgi:hypothetical protein